MSNNQAYRIGYNTKVLYFLICTDDSLDYNQVDPYRKKDYLLHYDLFHDTFSDLPLDYYMDHKLWRYEPK